MLEERRLSNQRIMYHNLHLLSYNIHIRHILSGTDMNVREAPNVNDKQKQIAVGDIDIGNIWFTEEVKTYINSFAKNRIWERKMLVLLSHYLCLWY
ncbi:hypothetical protein AVEN_159399-1 [Araneus ventricosus]|uniref:Uncharacterized protein n=1 Tax=Araneus ventricosus TaxID=182803 RepID=A0A4Y2A0U9_ARAVE|nr:hypothetical protein AVEN_159399-1 [Araneus ventricosus]